MGHFHILLYEEIIFLLSKGKKGWTFKENTKKITFLNKISTNLMGMQNVHFFIH